MAGEALSPRIHAHLSPISQAWPNNLPVVFDFEITTSFMYSA